MKVKTKFVCQQCGALANQWSGQCTHCQQWNTLFEDLIFESKNINSNRQYANQQTEVMSPDAVVLTKTQRMDCKLSELNRVLGGGLVESSVVLLGGDPGIGKSTLLLETLANLSKEHKVLYVTGEESLQQVVMRGKRLQLPMENLRLLAETRVEVILAHAKKEIPKIMVIDSIQTIYTDQISSAPGGVSQVREAAAQLVRYDYQENVVIFLFGILY
jgi:DNA repair protein RadA/Sms